jgi:hypothetical protein
MSGAEARRSCSSRSSPPSRSVRASGSALPSFTASSPAMAARSPSTAGRARARASSSCCPRRRWRRSPTSDVAKRRPGQYVAPRRAAERCQSGRSGRSRKPLCPVRGTVGSNPTLSATLVKSPGNTGRTRCGPAPDRSKSGVPSPVLYPLARHAELGAARTNDRRAAATHVRVRRSNRGWHCEERSRCVGPTALRWRGPLSAVRGTSRGDDWSSARPGAIAHESLFVGDHRRCKRHRSARSVDALETRVLETALPRDVDLDHLPDGQRRAAARPDEAIPLTDFDVPVCRHDVPFPSLATAFSSHRKHVATRPRHEPHQHCQAFAAFAMSSVLFSPLDIVANLSISWQIKRLLSQILVASQRHHAFLARAGTKRQLATCTARRAVLTMTV